MDTQTGRPERRADAEDNLGALRDHVTAMAGRLGDTVAGREVERRFDVFAAEVRAEEPLLDVVRAAGGGLVLAAARWDDLGLDCARIVGRLVSSVEGDAAVRKDAALPPEEEAEADDFEPTAEAEPAAEAPMDDAGPDGIGAPIYPPGG